MQLKLLLRLVSLKDLLALRLREKDKAAILIRDSGVRALRHMLVHHGGGGVAPIVAHHLRVLIGAVPRESHFVLIRFLRRSNLVSKGADLCRTDRPMVVAFCEHLVLLAQSRMQGRAQVLVN